jgi:hypothetical protein
MAAAIPPRPTTGAAAGKSVVVPLPSWPSRLCPQQRTVPLLSSAQEWELPVAIAVTLPSGAPDDVPTTASANRPSAGAACSASALASASAGGLSKKRRAPASASLANSSGRLARRSSRRLSTSARGGSLGVSASTLSARVGEVVTSSAATIIAASKECLFIVRRNYRPSAQDADKKGCARTKNACVNDNHAWWASYVSKLRC